MPDPLPNATYIQSNTQQAPTASQQLGAPQVGLYGVTQASGPNQVTPVPAQGREALLAPYQVQSPASQVFSQPGATWGQYYGSMATPNLPAANMDTRMIQMMGNQQIMPAVPDSGADSKRTSLMGLLGFAAPLLAGGSAGISALGGLLRSAQGGNGNTSNPQQQGPPANLNSGTSADGLPLGPPSGLAANQGGEMNGPPTSAMMPDFNGFFSPAELDALLNANPSVLQNLGQSYSAPGTVAIAQANATGGAGGQGGQGGQGGSVTFNPNININQSQTAPAPQLSGGILGNLVRSLQPQQPRSSFPANPIDTVGEVDAAWSPFYEAMANWKQDKGMFSAALGDRQVSANLLNQSKQGPSYYGYDPTLPVFNPYLPQNYNPSYIGVRPLYGTGDPNYGQGGDDWIPAISPGSPNAVAGIPNTNLWGQAQGGISSGPQINEYSRGYGPDAGLAANPGGQIARFGYPANPAPYQPMSDYADFTQTGFGAFDWDRMPYIY